MKLSTASSLFIASILLFALTTVSVQATTSSIDLIGRWNTSKTLTFKIVAKGGVPQSTVDAALDVITSTANGAQPVGDSRFGYWGVKGALDAVGGGISVGDIVTDKTKADITVELKNGAGSVLGQAFLKRDRVNSFIIVGCIVRMGGNLVFGSPQEVEFFKTVLRHELMHCLGLGHASDSNDLMYGTLNYYPKLISECLDVEALKALYVSGVSSPQTVIFTCPTSI
ncbi:MAG: matrixin family metalloprotease [Nitrososphaerota archaeon]